MASPYAIRPLLLLTLSLIPLHVHATCYWQNSAVLAADDPDAIAPDDTACFPDQDNSPCCATGWTCLSDGVCLIRQGDNDFYYRGTCTDRTWNSQQCPGWCFAQNANSSIPLAKCDGEQDWYCCPGDADCSCDTGKNAVKLGASQPTTVTVIGSTTWPGFTSTTEAFTAQPLNTEGTSTTGSGSASDLPSTTAASTGSQSSTGNTAAAASASPTGASGDGGNDSNNSTALAAGLGAGLGGAAVLGAGLAFFFIRRRRQRKADAATAAAAGQAKETAYEEDGRSNGSVVKQGPGSGSGAGGVHEFYGGQKPASTTPQAPVEMGTPGQGAVEMGGRNLVEMDGGAQQQQQQQRVRHELA